MTKKEFFLGLAITLILLVAFFAFFVKPKYGPQIERVNKEKVENKKVESSKTQEGENQKDTKK